MREISGRISMTAAASAAAAVALAVSFALRHPADAFTQDYFRCRLAISKPIISSSCPSLQASATAELLASADIEIGRDVRQLKNVNAKKGISKDQRSLDKRSFSRIRKAGAVLVQPRVPMKKKSTEEIISSSSSSSKQVIASKRPISSLRAPRQSSASARVVPERTRDRSNFSHSKNRLFTLERERELVYKIRALRNVLEAREDYEAIHDTELQSEEEWAAAIDPPLLASQLGKIVEEGHAARATVLAENEGLVIQIAKRYQNPNLLGSALTLQDMIQEGKMGLLEAAERFDPERGFRFSTYSSYWIRQKILRCIAEHSRTIRLPAHIHSMLHTIIKARKEVTQQIGRTPSIPELAHHINLPVDKLRSVMESARHVVSLELPLNNRRSNNKVDTRTLSDTLPSDMPTPEDQAEMDFLKRDIHAVLHEQLSDREKDVLLLRFGLQDGTPKTIDEVAKRMNVSRDRVRIVEARALNKLRHPGRNYKLKEYVGDVVDKEGGGADYDVTQTWTYDRKWMF